MGDPVAESWHIPRALSDEALRLLTSLPMEEIERRLRAPMASDGEVAELVVALRADAECVAAEQPDLMQLTDKQLTRAADLLERQAAAAPVARLPKDAQVIEPANHTILVPVPAPVPVCERLPGPEDCDAESCCWRWNTIGRLWTRQQYARKWYEFHTHWLPAHALPLPEVK